MSRKAIIDVGSNSIKFLLAERDADGTIRTIVDENNIARLGESLRQTGIISLEAMERNAEAIAAFAARARASDAEQIVCVGTMALRTAGNSQDFLELVRRTSDLELQVLAGEEEARLSYLAVLSGLPLQSGELVVFDTGGGSTEFVFGRGPEVANRFSVNLGAIRITEDLLVSDPVTQVELNMALEEIDQVFEQHAVTGRPAQLVGMGGTVTSLGAVKHQMTVYDPDVIQGSTLELDEVKAQIEMYRSKNLAERREIVGLQPKRADVILAGACIVQVIMERLGVEYLTISDRGLRHGLAYSLFSE